MSSELRDRITKVMLPANDDEINGHSPGPKTPRENKSVRTPKPVVLVSVLNDDKTRGDAAGWKGLGQSMANMLDTRCMYIDDDVLEALYPEFSGAGTSFLYRKFITEFGHQDIIIGRLAPDAFTGMSLYDDHTMHVSRINESLSSNYLREPELVSHHLTPEILDEAGEMFDQNYPDIKKPLITVFLSVQGPESIEDFTEKMTDILQNYKQGTIFFCGSRRTYAEDQIFAVDGLNQKLAESGLDQKFDIINWEFDRQGYNPYKGLIARSDHFVLWGSSQSLLSEPLVTGRTVHTYNNGDNKQSLTSRGYVFDLMNIPEGQGFQTLKQKPLNITDQLAEKILEEFNKNRRNELRYYFHKIRDTKNIPKKLQDVLARVYFDPEQVRNIPLKYLQRAEFQDILFETNKYCVAYLPDTVLDYHGAASRFVSRFPTALGLLPDKYRDDYDFIYNNFDDLGEIYEFLGPNLSRDEAIARQIVTEQSSRYASLRRELRADPDLLRMALDNSLHMLERDVFSNNPRQIFDAAPDEIRADRDFIISIDPRLTESVFDMLPESLRGDKQICMTVAQKDPQRYKDMTENMRKDPDLIDICLRNNDSMNSVICAEYLPESITGDAEKCLDILRDNPLLGQSENMISHWSRDPEFFHEILKISADAYQYAPESLTSQPDLALEILERATGKANVYRFWAAELAHDETFIRLAIAIDPNTIYGAALGIQSKRDIVEPILPDIIERINGLNFDWVNNPDLALKALELSDECFFWLPLEILNNRDFVLQAVEIDPSIFFIINGNNEFHDLSIDKDIVFKVLNANLKYLELINPEFYENEAVMAEFVEKKNKKIVNSPSLYPITMPNEAIYKILQDFESYSDIIKAPDEFLYTLYTLDSNIIEDSDFLDHVYARLQNEGSPWRDTTDRNILQVLTELYEMDYEIRHLVDFTALEKYMDHGIVGSPDRSTPQDPFFTNVDLNLAI